MVCHGIWNTKIRPRSGWMHISQTVTLFENVIRKNESKRDKPKCKKHHHMPYSFHIFRLLLSSCLYLFKIGEESKPQSLQPIPSVCNTCTSWVWPVRHAKCYYSVCLMSLIQEEMLFLSTTRSKIYLKNSFCPVHKLKEYLLFMKCLEYNSQKKYSTVVFFKTFSLNSLQEMSSWKIQHATWSCLTSWIQIFIYSIRITNIYILKMLATWISQMLLDHSNHCVCMNQSIAQQVPRGGSVWHYT